MPPEDQMGQDNSQSMDTSSNMIPQIMPNISSRGKLNMFCRPVKQFDTKREPFYWFYWSNDCNMTDFHPSEAH